MFVRHLLLAAIVGVAATWASSEVRADESRSQGYRYGHRHGESHIVNALHYLERGSWHGRHDGRWLQAAIQEIRYAQHEIGDRHIRKHLDKARDELKDFAEEHEREDLEEAVGELRRALQELRNRRPVIQPYPYYQQPQYQYPQYQYPYYPQYRYPYQQPQHHTEPRSGVQFGRGGISIRF
jgi:polyhydroxyalkanoate synthesis regulator phasin